MLRAAAILVLLVSAAGFVKYTFLGREATPERVEPTTAHGLGNTVQCEVRDARAWVSAMPPGPPRLIVTAEVEGARGEVARAELNEASGVLTLELAPAANGGRTYSLRYETAAEVRYSAVRFTLEGVEVARVNQVSIVR